MPRWIDLQKLGLVWIGWFVFTVFTVCLGLFPFFHPSRSRQMVGAFFRCRRDARRCSPDPPAFLAVGDLDPFAGA